MNQEEADQDVVDEVSEEVDSRGKMMQSKILFSKIEAAHFYALAVPNLWNKLLFFSSFSYLYDAIFLRLPNVSIMFSCFIHLCALLWELLAQFLPGLSCRLLHK